MYICMCSFILVRLLGKPFGLAIFFLFFRFGYSMNNKKEEANTNH